MRENQFSENPYAAPREEVIRAEVVDRPRPNAKPRSPWVAGVLLLASLPFAVAIGRMWLNAATRWQAGDTSLIDSAPQGAIPIVVLVSLVVFGGIPVCLHEIVQAIRRR